MPTGSIKISELPALAPVPFNTDLVGIDCDTSITHKIKLTEVRDTFKATFVQNAQTASMLQPYVLTAQTASMLQPYVLTATTASMLQPYVLTAQTASMLQPYVSTAQTASMLQPYVLTESTSSMLQPYVLTTNTASMLEPYVLSSQTASMLEPYTLTSQTASMLDPYVQTASTASMLEPYVLSSQTSSMSVATASYVETAQTASYYAETDPIYNAEKATLATTGSNTFVGNQIVSGGIYMVTGSIILPNGTEIYDTGNSGSTSGIGLGNNGFGIDFGSNVNDWAIFQNTNLIQMAPTSQFSILITSQGEYAWNFNAIGMGFPDGTNQTTAYTGPIETGSFATTSSNTFVGNQTITGSLVITGSVKGNVISQSIVSNTASIDLSAGGFYTIDLQASTATHIEPTNIQPGLTVSILVTTANGASVTFPTNVKQISGSLYTPTSGSAKDILTLISFDSNNLYLANVKNLV